MGTWIEINLRGGCEAIAAKKSGEKPGQKVRKPGLSSPFAMVRLRQAAPNMEHPPQTNMIKSQSGLLWLSALIAVRES
jgi:hypothetical protein